MRPKDTAKTLQRLERNTRWLYWFGVSVGKEYNTLRWRVLRFIPIAFVGLWLILQLGVPFLVAMGNTEESSTEYVGQIVLLYIGMACLYFGLAQSGKRRYRHRRSFRAINLEIARSLSRVRREHLDLLCRVLRNTEGVLWSDLKVQLESTIANFLFMPETEDIPLSSDSVGWLKYQAQYGKNPTLRVAALITFKDRNIDGLQKLALSASRSDNERVRAAARDVLTTQRGTR